MAFSIDAALGIHPQALSLKAKRAEVIANNLANAQTPGYRPMDLDFKKVLQDIGSPQPTLVMSGTSASHISPASSAADHLIEFRVKTSQRPDGNRVNTEQEQAAYAKNATDYLASLQFFYLEKFAGS